MLESEIKKLTVALEANTIALLADKGTPPAVVAAAKAAAAPAAAATPATEPAAEPAAAAPAATKKDVVEVIIRLAKEKGREVAAGLLAEFGATRVPELKDASVYGDLVAKANAILEA